MGRNKDEKKVKEPIILTEEERKVEQAKTDEKKRRKALRNEITHKLRFEVLERDNYTCSYCGKSPKTTPGTQLEVDHIKPLSGGGNNDLTNLITACWECNEGKKDKRMRPADKSFVLNKEAIIEVAKTNDFDAFKKFLTADENQTERDYLFDYNDRLNKTYCLKDCKDCVISGTWWFKGCIQKLYRVAIGGMDESVIASAKDDEFAVDQKELQSDKVVVSSRDVVASNTNDLATRVGGMPVRNTIYDTLKCDFCYAALRCPKYKVGGLCAFDFTAGMNFNDPSFANKILTAVQGERIMRGVFFEKIDGGAMDKNVTNEIMVMLRMLGQIAESGQPRASIKIEGSSVGKEGAGVLKTLLNNLMNNGNGNGEEEIVQEATVIKDDKI